MTSTAALRGSPTGRLAPPAALLDAAVHLPTVHGSVPGALQSLGEHLRRYGPSPAAGLLDRLHDHALTGRGGAHFPVAAKWRSVMLTGGTATVVANGAESEPASAKDLVLLALRPHLVLDGLALAGAVLGARETVLWVHEDSAALPAVARALRERSTAGLPGPPVRVVTASATYLSGESGAIRRSLAGGPLLPAPDGGARHPGAAVVQNVETLARVALVARGLPGAADAALVTVLDDGLRTVVEAAPGETIAEVLRRVRGVGGPPPQAVLLGGYAGTWLPWRAAADRALAGPDRDADTGAGLRRRPPARHLRPRRGRGRPRLPGR